MLKESPGLLETPGIDKIDQVWQAGFENLHAIKGKSGSIVLGTEIGLRTGKNQDRAFLNTELDLFGVVDGMGGYWGGDIAAQIVAEEIITAEKQKADPAQMHRNAQKRMRDAQVIEGGACYLAVKIEGKKLQFWQAGDVSLFVVDEKGKIKFESEATDLGDSPRGISCGLSTKGTARLMNYDRIVVVSDGVTNNMDLAIFFLEVKNLKIVEAVKTLEERTKARMAMPLDIHNSERHGTHDNITILMYEILPVPLRGK